MLCLPDYNFPYLIDDVSSPVIPKFSWYYDISLNDIVLRPILLLEESVGPTVRVKINVMEFNVPASWNLMIVDEETKTVDTVPIMQCSSSSYSALLLHPESNDYYPSPVILLDLYPSESCSYIMIPKMHMMLHPVGEINKSKKNINYCCLFSPQDLGKYISKLSAMEMIL